MPAGNAFEWLNRVSRNDAATMLDELAAAFRLAFSGEATWQEFDTVIDRWQERVRTACVSEAAAAFQELAESGALAVSATSAGPEAHEPEADAVLAGREAVEAPSEVATEPQPQLATVRPPEMPRMWKSGNQTFYRIRRYS